MCCIIRWGVKDMHNFEDALEGRGHVKRVIKAYLHGPLLSFHNVSCRNSLGGVLP